MEHTKQPLVSVLDTQTLPARKPFDQMVDARFHYVTEDQCP